MSVWTHVNGAIRLDALFIEEAAAQQIEDVLKNGVPEGSEGPIQWVFIPNNEHSIELGRIYIFGDLRDFDDFDETETWFNKVCQGLLDIKGILSIRQAVIQVQVDDRESKVYEFKPE